MSIKHIHFIGIAGTLIAPLAVAMQEKGWRVTGSDQAFYPPMSTYLEDNKIKIIPGYNPSKFDEIGKPNLAVMMSFLTKENPEVQYMIENNVELISLGQLLEKHFIKENSIVVTGNYGKTTITSLLAWILEVAGMDPTVLAGGYLHNFKGGVKIGKSNWSVAEGDEFKNWDISREYDFTRKPRILYQKPTHVIFTDATWDHYDQYTSEEEYLNTFKEFVTLIPKDGFIIGNATGKNVKEVLSASKAQSKITEIDLSKIIYNDKGSSFDLDGETYETPMLGAIGVQNTTLAISLATKVGINPDKIKEALSTYKGVKRRQEIRFEAENLTVIDDFAHSPTKLRGLIEALRLHHPNDRIILLYQPGSKNKEALTKYNADTFKGIDYLLLPKVSAAASESRHFNKELSRRLASDMKEKIAYIEDDEKLVEHILSLLNKKTDEHTLIVFAAQKGFRGMIEELITSLHQ